MKMKNTLLWFMTFFFIIAMGCSNIETNQVPFGNREERGLYSRFAGSVEREGDDQGNSPVIQSKPMNLGLTTRGLRR